MLRATITGRQRYSNFPGGLFNDPEKRLAIVLVTSRIDQTGLVVRASNVRNGPNGKNL
jgi:hypothetical protein